MSMLLERMYSVKDLKTQIRRVLNLTMKTVDKMRLYKVFSSQIQIRVKVMKHLVHLQILSCLNKIQKEGMQK